MSTLTALYIQSNDDDQVQEICTEWLCATHRTKSVSVNRGGFPLKAFVKVFEEKPPSLLVVGSTHPGWVSVHYNSFYEMEDLVTRLSDDLKCRGVVVMAQTVSDYYFISVYEQGKRLRVLEVEEGDRWLVQEGIPLPFESDPLGKNIAEPGEEPLYFFGQQEAEAYCNELGFSIWGGEYEPEWAILSARRKWWPFGR
jgi:hypothetical protein